MCQVIIIFYSNYPFHLFQPNYNYRESVKKALGSSLKQLDDELLIKDEEPKISMPEFEEDWRLIEELMKEGAITTTDDSVETIGMYGILGFSIFLVHLIWNFFNSIWSVSGYTYGAPLV